MNRGCPKEIQPDEEARKKTRCSLKRCKKSDPLPFICSSCHHQFCIQHRNPIDHECISVVNNSLKNVPAKPPKQRSRSIFQFLMKQENSKKPTAQIVSLQKMKNRAIGDVNIPPEKRFYLEIVYPLNSKVQPKLMFFSSTATVGRILDIVAKEGKIDNRNNQPDAEKLHLISLKSGEPFPYSAELGSLLPKLKSGESLLLDTIENITN